MPFGPDLKLIFCLKWQTVSAFYLFFPLFLGTRNLHYTKKDGLFVRVLILESEFAFLTEPQIPLDFEKIP